MDKRGAVDLDVVILISTLLIGIVGLFMLSSKWGLFGICFAIALGIWEAVSKLRSGVTLTQRFKKLLKEHSWKAYAGIIGLNIFWIALMIHLIRPGGLWK